MGEMLKIQDQKKLSVAKTPTLLSRLNQLRLGAEGKLRSLSPSGITNDRTILDDYITHAWVLQTATSAKNMQQVQIYQAEAQYALLEIANQAMVKIFGSEQITQTDRVALSYSTACVQQEGDDITRWVSEYHHASSLSDEGRNSIVNSAQGFEAGNFLLAVGTLGINTPNLAIAKRVLVDGETMLITQMQIDAEANQKVKELLLAIKGKKDLNIAERTRIIVDTLYKGDIQLFQLALQTKIDKARDIEGAQDRQDHFIQIAIEALLNYGGNYNVVLQNLAAINNSYPYALNRALNGIQPESLDEVYA